MHWLSFSAFTRDVRPFATLLCSHFDHDHVQSPLLPPDEIHSSKDNSVDGTARSSTYKNPIDARSNYKRLQQGRSSVYRRRHFVFGALYNNLFGGYHTVDPMMGDFDLKITLSSTQMSIVRVRLVSPEEGKGRDTLLQSIISLGKTFRGPGNSRGSRVGDVGGMHAVGIRSTSPNKLFVGTEERASKIMLASNLMRHWMEDYMRSDLLDILSNDVNVDSRKPLHFMPEGPGSRVIVSVDLANSAHYDIGDASVSVAVWVEEKPGEAENWYFVLPNVSYQGKAGLVVKLCHGAAISWDGREIFHCTSKTRPGVGNKVYGCMWGASK